MGGFSESALKPLLRRGGNPPAPAFPQGKRERGSSDFLAAGSLSWHDADGRDSAGSLRKNAEFQGKPQLALFRIEDECILKCF
jgi:hypothetical protein